MAGLYGHGVRAPEALWRTAVFESINEKVIVR
jgi:hypothetical protein